MALTYNVVGRGSIGDLAVRVVDVTLDNAYPSGGWPLTARDLGLGSSGTVFAVFPVNDVTGRVLTWDRTNNKLMCRDFSGAANAASPEITTATQMNAVVARLVVYGKGHG
jgi:hypothetical protein